MWVSYLLYSINIYVVDGYTGEPLSAMYPAVMSGDLGMVVKLQQEGQLRVDEKYHALTKHFLCCWPVMCFPQLHAESSSTPFNGIG